MREKKLYSKNIRIFLNLFDWCICLVIVLLNCCYYYSIILCKEDFKFFNCWLKEYEGKDWFEYMQVWQLMVFVFIMIIKEVI